MKDTSHSIEILVIEDNLGDYLLVEDYLIEKFSTPKITHCKSFTASAKLAAEQATFSVILLDLVLPDFQKEKLVEKVQGIFKDTPIVVLTGYTDVNLARSLIAKGVSDFLIKDEINPELLYRTIVYAIERENFVIGLEHSKNTYQNLFNFSPQPMWLYDNDSLAFLDVNEATIDKYGYSKDEFLKMTLKDIRPKSENELLDKSLTDRAVVKKSFYAGIFEHLLKSGEIVNVEIHSRFIEYVIENQNTKLKKIAWSQSHETRAPLARFMGLVSLLEIDMNASEDVKFLFKQLKISADELDEIIRRTVNESQTINLKKDE